MSGCVAWKGVYGVTHVRLAETAELRVGRRVYTLEFDDYFGPVFFFKNGKPYYPSPRAPVWKAFEEWYERRTWPEKKPK
jgi:hypothetical protein